MKPREGRVPGETADARQALAQLLPRCPGCGRPFVPTRPRQRCCRPSCRRLAERGGKPETSLFSDEDERGDAMSELRFWRAVVLASELVALLYAAIIVAVVTWRARR